VPLEFLKRRHREVPGPTEPGPALPPDDVEAEDYVLRLTYRAKCSHGVRMSAGPGVVEQLPGLLGGLARSGVALVEPLTVENQAAAPRIVDPVQAMAWVNAHHGASPVTRHALMVLESLDALDPAFETAALALFAGETDTSGYPEYDAVIGGVVSHWDETTGDIVVRGIVCWGGKGVRGDTERTASRHLATLLANILANQNAIGLTAGERPIPAAKGGGLVCSHCGFASAHDRAFYCPKCGMRMVRG
jgi:hypothetical protein